jgi:hypothetical protein
VSSHEVFPSSFSVIDAVEHTGATSRRGYSPKQATLQKTYADVIQLLVAAGMPITPTLALSGASLRQLGDLDPAFRTDARFGLYPVWLTAALTGNAAAGGRGGGGGGRGARGGRVGGGAGGAGGAGGGGPGGDPRNAYLMVMNLMKAGTTILAGTDTPNAGNLHGELLTFVTAGMTPFQALQTATVNPARVLGLDAGSIEPGKLADLVIVDGNPLTDITVTTKVKQVMANGRVWSVADLLKAP